MSLGDQLNVIQLKQFYLLFSDIHDDFRATRRDYNGPRVVTKIAKKYCNLPKDIKLSEMNCNNFKILSSESFYPLKLDDVKQVNTLNVSKILKNKLKTSYGMHLWNVISKRKKMKLKTGTALDESMKNNCPLIYEHFNVY